MCIFKKYPRVSAVLRISKDCPKRVADFEFAVNIITLENCIDTLFSLPLRSLCRPQWRPAKQGAKMNFDAAVLDNDGEVDDKSRCFEAYWTQGFQICASLWPQGRAWDRVHWSFSKRQYVPKTSTYSTCVMTSYRRSQKSSTTYAYVSLWVQVLRTRAVRRTCTRSYVRLHIPTGSET